MIIETKRASGLALILVAGILALLSVGSVAMLRMASSLRAQTVVSTDAAAARLLARSGIAYAQARLAEGGTSPATPAPDNQADDWTYRDGPSVPLEKAVNPSYARTEPYGDLNLDGSYQEGVDSYRDLNANRRFDSWSGRLRGPEGMLGTVFLLKMVEGGSGLDVNNGIWTVDPLQANVLDAKKPVLPNRRLADVINELGTIVGTAAGSGDRLVSRRPVGGYRDLREVERAVGRADFQKLSPFLSIGGTPDRRDWFCPPDDYPWRTYRYGADPCVPIRLEHAAPELLQSLFQNIGISGKMPSGAGTGFWYGGESGFLPIDTGAVGCCGWNFRLQPQEAARLAAFLTRHRPFASWFNLFEALVREREQIWNPPSYTGPFDFINGAADLLGQYPLKTAVSYVTMHPEVAHTWWWLPAAALTQETEQGPPLSMWSPQRYRPRWGVSNFLRDAGGRRDLRSYPLSLNAADDMQVESLGRVGEGSATAGVQKAEFRHRPFLSARVQSEFENLREKENDSGAARCVGRPARDRVTSFPIFPLDSCRDLKEDPRYLFAAWGGDLRLMDASEGAQGAGFYVPSWEAAQPLREEKTGAEWRYNFRDAVRGKEPEWDWPFPPNTETLPPDRIDRLLWGDAYTPPGSGLVPSRSSLALYSASGNWRKPFAWDPAKGEKFLGLGPDATLRAYTLSFWTVYGGFVWSRHDSNNNGNGDQITLRVVSGFPIPPYLEYRQRKSPLDDAMIYPFTFPLEWFHLALAIDDEEGKVTMMLNGIVVGNLIEDAFELSLDEPQFLDMSNNSIDASVMDEFRIHPRALTQREVMPRALNRFWLADPGAAEPELHPVPSFTSPLYVFNGGATVTEGTWEGYVPRKMRGGADPALRVELLCYDRTDGSGPERRVPLSADGSPKRLSVYGVRSLRYRVWLDAAENPRDTPVFDGIDVSYGTSLMQTLSQAEY